MEVAGSLLKLIVLAFGYFLNQKRVTRKKIRKITIKRKEQEVKIDENIREFDADNLALDIDGLLT